MFTSILRSKTARITLALITVLGAAACSRATADGGASGDRSSSGESAKQGAFAVGDVVVARQGGTGFSEARLESLTGSRAKVVWSGSTSAAVEVVLSDVFALPAPGAAVSFETGKLVLGRRSANVWRPDRVVSASGGAITLQYNGDAAPVTLSPDKVIAVTAAHAAEFEADAKRAEFEQAAEAAGAPARPAGWRPKSGEAVVAIWVSSSWYSGKVQSVSGDKAVIAWSDGTRPSEVAFEKMVPEPRASKTPREGGFVLVRPTSGARWSRAKVTAGSGGKVDVVFVDGTTRSLAPADFLPLG